MVLNTFPVPDTVVRADGVEMSGVGAVTRKWDRGVRQRQGRGSAAIQSGPCCGEGACAECVQGTGVTAPQGFPGKQGKEKRLPGKRRNMTVKK